MADEGDCRLRTRDRSFRRKRWGIRTGNGGGHEKPSLEGEKMDGKELRGGL